MPEWGEVMDAQRMAHDAQTSLGTYAEKIEDGYTGDVSLMVALAADALIYRIAASTMQLGYYLQRIEPA